MPDIIVTTPKRFIEAARQEADSARELWEQDGEMTWYFRNFPGPAGRCPKIVEGERLYYVEDGFLRGFGVIDRVEHREVGLTCGTHGIQWPAGLYLYWSANSWQWIRPIPMTGFQGWRYVRYTGSDEEHRAKRVGIWAPREGVKERRRTHSRSTDPYRIDIAGGWLDPMPGLDQAQPIYKPSGMIFPDGTVVTFRANAEPRDMIQIIGEATDESR